MKEAKEENLSQHAVFLFHHASKNILINLPMLINIRQSLAIGMLMWIHAQTGKLLNLSFVDPKHVHVAHPISL